MVEANNTEPALPTLFVIRVTDPAHDHKLLGYSFVQQTAFFPAHGDNEASPEIRITLEGLQQLFDKGGEYAFAAVPFVAGHDPHTGAMMVGANVSGANVDPPGG